MRLLSKWPVPETFAAIIISSIVSRIVQDLPTGIMLGLVVGTGIAVIGNRLRDKYDADY